MNEGVMNNEKLSQLPITTFLNDSKIPALLISEESPSCVWFNNAFSLSFGHHSTEMSAMEELFTSSLRISSDITHKFLHNPSTSELALFIKDIRWNIRKDYLPNLELYIITFINISLFEAKKETSTSFFFNNIPLPCLMFDFSSGNIEAINKAFASLIMIPTEHILTMSILDLLCDNKQVLEPYLKSEKPYQNSFLINFYSIYYNATLILEALPIIQQDTVDENSYKVVFMFSDISSTITEERNLIKQQLSYDFITKAMTDAVLLVQDGVIKSTNTAACNIWQYEKHEIVGKDITELIPDVERLSKSLTSAKGHINFTGKRRTGSTFKGQFTLKSIDDIDSRTFIYIIIDLTEKHIAKNLYSNSAEDVSTQILNAYPNMLAIIDNSGLLINSNQALLDFFGYPTIEALLAQTQDISTLFQPGSKVNMPNWFKVQDGKDNSIIILKNKNNENSFFSIQSTFIRDSASSHYIISFTDVTSIYSTTRVLEDAKKKLETINDEMQEHLAVNSKMLLEYQKLSTIGTMITFITHQWKQPLNAIGLISQNLYDIFNEEENFNKEDITKMASSIMEHIFFMSETIENFNFFMKPQSTTMPFNAVEAISNILTLLTPVLNKNHIKIDICYEAPSEKVELVGFSNHLKQVVMNILSNAKDAILEYKHKTGDVADGLVTLRTYVENNNFCITITDSGTGLTQDQIQKIFSKNYSTKGASGMGIGMYITDTIVSNMNGSISISSKINEGEEDLPHGAEFTVKIPITRH